MTDNKTVLQALAPIEQETETPRRISSLFKKSCFANNVVTTKVLINLLFKEGSFSLATMVVLVRCGNCGKEFPTVTVQIGSKQASKGFSEKCTHCGASNTYGTQDLLWKDR